MSQDEPQPLSRMISGRLVDCFTLFRPDDPHLGRLYDHVLDSQLIGALIGPAMSEQAGLTLGDWFEAWNEAAHDLVPDHVEHTAAELREVHARINGAMLSFDLEPPERLRLLERLQRQIDAGWAER